MITFVEIRFLRSTPCIRPLARLLDTPGLEIDPAFHRRDPPAAAR